MTRAPHPELASATRRAGIARHRVSAKQVRTRSVPYDTAVPTPRTPMHARVGQRAEDGGSRRGARRPPRCPLPFSAVDGDSRHAVPMVTPMKVSRGGAGKVECSLACSGSCSSYGTR